MACGILSQVVCRARYGAGARCVGALRHPAAVRLADPLALFRGVVHVIVDRFPGVDPGRCADSRFHRASAFQLSNAFLDSADERRPSGGPIAVRGHSGARQTGQQKRGRGYPLRAGGFRMLRGSRERRQRGTQYDQVIVHLRILALSLFSGAAAARGDQRTDCRRRGRICLTGRRHCLSQAKSIAAMAAQ
jgi:hypothetical protein